MADAAAARREARRRRILENSHNRLQIISGKSEEEFSRESPIRAVIPDQNCDIPLSSDISSCHKAPINNGVIVTESETFDLLSLSHDIAAGDGEVPSDLASFTSPVQGPAQQTTPLWEKLTSYRYDIVVLSLIIQLMHSMSLVTFDGTYFFLPLLVYVITKLIWFPTQSNSKFASVLLLLNGMTSSRRVQTIIFVTQCLGVISRDVCVFLFTTICVQSLLITLKNGLIT